MIKHNNSMLQGAGLLVAETAVNVSSTDELNLTVNCNACVPYKTAVCAVTYSVTLPYNRAVHRPTVPYSVSLPYNMAVHIPTVTYSVPLPYNRAVYNSIGLQCRIA